MPPRLGCGRSMGRVRCGMTHGMPGDSSTRRTALRSPTRCIRRKNWRQHERRWRSIRMSHSHNFRFCRGPSRDGGSAHHRQAAHDGSLLRRLCPFIFRHGNVSAAAASEFVMREYGQIQSAFWQSEDAEAMSERGRLLACYLMTGPYTNGLGCFRCTDGNLTDDFGWSSETVSETLSELSRIGFAYRLGKVLFLPNFLRWNPIANPKVAIARIKELETLPTHQAKALAARALLTFCKHL